MEGEHLDIDDIFTYNERYQEHTGDDIIFYDCVLKVDFGPFKKGHKCNICIDRWNFQMWVGCDGMGHGGKVFVPVWTYMEGHSIPVSESDSDSSDSSELNSS